MTGVVRITDQHLRLVAIMAREEWERDRRPTRIRKGKTIPGEPHWDDLPEALQATLLLQMDYFIRRLREAEETL